MRSGISIGRRLSSFEVLAGDPGLHPDLRGDLGKGHSVKARVGEDADHETAVVGIEDRPGESRPTHVLDVSQCVAIEAGHAHERPDTGEELLTGLIGPGRQALGGAGGQKPILFGGHGVGENSIEQVGPGARGRLGPCGGVLGHRFDGGVEAGGIEVRRSGGGRVRWRRRESAPARRADGALPVGR